MKTEPQLWTKLLQCWGKFNGVGILGAGVQLLLIQLLHAAALPVSLATVVAVEITLIHNFYWHWHWTWPCSGINSWRRSFLRFQLSNGLISLLGNLIVTTLLVNKLGYSLGIANSLAILGCAGGNFLLAQYWVFNSSASK
jgi:putative flippase GtrA